MEPTSAESDQCLDAEKAEEPPLLSQTEKENSIQTDKGIQRVQPSVHQSQQLCRFYSQGKHCHYGRRCRFMHQRSEATEALRSLENMGEEKPEPPKDKEEDASRDQRDGDHTHHHSTGHKITPGKQERTRKPCRYFLSGFCAMEDRCRFWHPQDLPPVEDQQGPKPMRSTRPVSRAPVTRPSAVKEEAKLADLTEDVCRELRDTEISQLMKRFPKDKLIVQEREDGKLTYYRVTVEATDPDWPFDLKEIDIMVSFPDNYPQEVFTVDVPEDQDLPSVMGRHVQQASQEWLQAKHATGQLMGKVELLFRPYLRWLDRSMERLFTEGARQLKKEIDMEKAGIQFVPYQQLQAVVLKKTADGKPDAEPDDPAHSGESEGESEEEEEDDGEEGMEHAELGSDGEEGRSRQVENIKSSEPRRGTEIKLQGLSLGENTATVVARNITVSLQCSRCKVTSDLTLSGRVPCTAQCEKCGAGISATFRPSMLHHYSDVLGYLDLNGAVPVDLVLQACDLVVGCLSCSSEDIVQNVSYGQNKETNCQHCHSKLALNVDSTSFKYIQPQSRKPAGQSGSAAFGRQYFRDPAVQRGKPLPDKGACRHYKQSHRWLRFPCCGRAYPCDVCHDEDQDHLMELATRMICGFCAKEQPYSNDKPCVSCGGMMTRTAYTSHWEGGLGCRNKAKMSRNDRHKYLNTCKTVSRKAKAEKK
ncbi:uncharacterized protein si:dkey-24l11.2 [Chanos chanos]|uniref:Nucleoporin NUP42 n=1 Tax=Chanos chanos TaxID=29144 RepID=A0A6J2URF2_CHACN|nr:uncharacterized protein LOC115805452 [Chanos chanos]